ncbi:hypothetical protein GCM10009760_56230 [Kitasatospora kazusensis]|uniref:Uncharacterized protein n=1 Tax=Kitasatospora kazusensis TaxID=407974 RepID=A0ABP5LY96_9ACTN
MDDWSQSVDAVSEVTGPRTGSEGDSGHNPTRFDHGNRAQIGHLPTIYLILTAGNAVLSWDNPKLFGTHPGDS